MPALQMLSARRQIPQIRTFRVGFVSWDRFHVLGIDQHDFEQAFHQIEDRLPIHASPNLQNWGRPCQKGV